jgi:proline utilization trans-activator
MCGLSEVSHPEDYFLRAIEFFPDVWALYRESILEIEICCGLALYLKSVDHRNNAYVYLGLGLGIASSQGLHCDLLNELSDTEDRDRYHSAWWKLYILDMKLSSLMGAPSSIHDGDITVPLQEVRKPPQKSRALEIHVKLSRLVAKMLNTVYGIEGRLDSSLLSSVQAVLQELAKLVPALKAAFDFKFGSDIAHLGDAEFLLSPLHSPRK